MKNLKAIIAILSIGCFSIIGIILILIISEFKREIEGYGLLMAAIGGFAFYILIAFGVISLIMDIVSKNKKLPNLTLILLGYSLITFLGTMIYEYETVMNWLLLTICSIAIYLTLKEITQSGNEINLN